MTRVTGISGTATQGEILTADTSTLTDADGLGAFSYVWKADDAVITGATASSYTLTQAEVGKTINDEIGILGEAGWKAACDAAMTALGAYVSNEIAKINADTSSLTIQGQCKITDENADGYYDKMAQGLWTGTFSLNQNDAVVAGPENNFTGEKTN